MSEPNLSGHPIVGAWNLTSFTEKNVETGAIAYPLGAAARATVIYTADGHVATLFTAENRKPAAAPATDEEAAILYRTMIAFTGRYELHGAKLVYYPEISWNEAWNGTVQERLFGINGNRLEVSSVPTTSPLTGATMVFSLAWERM